MTDIGHNGMLRLYAATRLESPEQGCLTFPGGKLISGIETPIIAAARELSEETALTCSPRHLKVLGSPITLVTRDRQRITLHVFTIQLYQCRGATPKKQIPHHGPWQAFTLDEIALLPGDEIVRKIVMQLFSVPSHLLETCLIHQLRYVY